MIRSVDTVWANSALFRKRTPQAKTLWFGLAFHQGQHFCGLFQLGTDQFSAACGMDAVSCAAAAAELREAGLLLVDEARDLVLLPEMTRLAAGMAKDGSTTHKAVDKYIASLGESPLCKQVCDTLSIPYRYPIDRALLGSESGADSGKESGNALTPTPAKTPERAHVAPPVPDLRPGDGVQGSLLPELAPSERPAPASAAVITSMATMLLQELSAARIRVNPLAKPIPVRPDTLCELERCLRTKIPAEQIRNVIAVWEVLVRTGQRKFGDFDSISPFRKGNVGKYTTMRPEDAARDNREPTPAKSPSPQWRHDPTVGRRKSVEEIQRERDEWAAKTQR